MTSTILSVLASDEMFAWAAQAEAVSSQIEDMFLGNAQGGDADFDDYEVCQMMASGF